jgi:hypothetical protein
VTAARCTGAAALSPASAGRWPIVARQEGFAFMRKIVKILVILLLPATLGAGRIGLLPPPWARCSPSGA